MRSVLQPFLLLLIHERPGHGYDLIERLNGLGLTEVEPAQVYRALRSLERDRAVTSAWVTSAAGPARRRYELTAVGRASLPGWTVQLGQLHEAVGRCLSRWTQAQARVAAGACPPQSFTSARSGPPAARRGTP